MEQIAAAPNPTASQVVIAVAVYAVVISIFVAALNESQTRTSTIIIILTRREFADAHKVTPLVVVTAFVVLLVAILSELFACEQRSLDTNCHHLYHSRHTCYRRIGSLLRQQSSMAMSTMEHTAAAPNSTASLAVIAAAVYTIVTSMSLVIVAGVSIFVSAGCAGCVYDQSCVDHTAAVPTAGVCNELSWASA